MKRIIFTFLIFTLAILASGTLLAQVNAKQASQEFQERLNAGTKHQVELQQTPTKAPDSIDDYCIPSGDCNYGDGFTDFAFAGIENYASGCSPDGYGDFTAMQGTAEIGFTYTVTMGTGYQGQQASMWIDYNDDDTFSDAERIITDFAMNSSAILYEVDITIFGDALPGIHRMRIGSNFNAPSSPDPCANLQYGEWEDYMIEIAGAPISFNAGVVSIDIATAILPGDIIPMATVTNNGVETISFPVTMTEPSTGYSSTVDIVDLAMGQTSQVEFDTWTVGIGAYDIEICTALAGDEIPDDDCKTQAIAFTDQPRQKVVAEFFTSTLHGACPPAEASMSELHQIYNESLAVIAWHNGDEFELEQGMVRDEYYSNTQYPTVWFDGWQNFEGGPPSYLYYAPFMEERVPWPSNFEVSMEITNTESTDYNVGVTIDIIHGNSTENLAGFVVLTESALPSPDVENQNFVARNVWPDAMGLPLDFSTQTSHTWNTVITIEDNYILENCEVVVFIQNMDTKEIYQGTSLMADDITTGVSEQQIHQIQVYPNPATDRVNIKASSKIKAVQVYSQIGQLVYETSANSNILNFDVRQFESGIYLFRIQTSEGMFVESVIIK